MTGRRAPYNQLTPTEKIVVILLAQRLSYREIGTVMRVRSQTVGGYAYNVYTKLGVSGRYELIDLIEESTVVFLRGLASSIGAELCAE